MDGTYTDLPTPAVGGYEVRPEEITKSSRNTLGNLYKYRIAVKRSIVLKWVAISPTDKDMVLQATAENSFQVKYFDIQEGTYKYGKFYRGNDLSVLPYPPFKDGEFRMYDISMSIVEM
jgi:predicted RNA-binding protein associated with RNAse of E/G family